jgi:FAD/FMN-containing dehydrogenase
MPLSLSRTIEYPENLANLSRSSEELRAASLDFGRIHSAEPMAVLLPHSAADIAGAVRWAAERGVPVGARGRGHNGSGYAQAPGGIVVDTRTLATVHRVTPEFVEAETGCDWNGVLARTLPPGLRPPVLPSHQLLSVGGVLSVGGIGEASFRHGTVGSSVIDFELVTGAGEILLCSPDSHADLFAACLGGFGQFGIMTRAKIALVPVPPRQRLTRLLYTDPADYAADFSRLLDCGDRIEGLMGSAIPNTRSWIERVMGPISELIWLRKGEFPWLLVLEVRYPPEYEDELDALQYIPAARYMQECAGFIDFEPVPSNRDAHNIWLHLMVPIARAPEFIHHVFKTLDVDPETDGPVTVYPIVPARLPATAFRAPEADKLLLFDLMPVVSAGDHARLERVMECLRRTSQVAEDLGGMCYPVGGLRYTPEDWKRHFAPDWENLLSLKKRYDPAMILGPGPAIFRPSDFV